jgi:uncharacterized membrane protein YgdD (TMEM256/DUF423 family)
MGVAAALMATGIGIGALGSHALRAVLLPRQLESLATAVNYQLINALGLLLIGLLMKSGSVQLRWVARLLIAGIVCFSGGIYLMLGGAPRPFGFVTPVGGVLIIIAWVMLAWRLLEVSVIQRR